MFSQTPTAGDFATVPGVPAYVLTAPVNADQIAVQPLNTNLTNITLNMPADGSDSSNVFMNSAAGFSQPSGGGNSGLSANNRAGQGGNSIFQLIGPPTFTRTSLIQAGPSTNGTIRYSTLGGDPAVGGTTTIPTNLDEVNLQLLNADGSTFKTVSFAPFERLTLNSPNFQSALYTSSPHPTQYQNAVMRAQFSAQLKNSSWDTLLGTPATSKRTIQVPYYVNVRLSNGTIIRARAYFTGTAGDGSTFVLMLNLLFNFLFDNAVIDNANNGFFTSDAVNIEGFPNTYLFSLNQSNPNAPGGCCTLGFHTYFYSGGFPQTRLLVDYASWISPGIFGGGFQDVTALSHEIGETFNDPYLDNLTPSWQFPGEPPTAKVCQGNLETGDPIEVLSNATYPVTVNGYTYHPQNLALVQWFQLTQMSGTPTPSDALGGAFSYPNTSTLPHAAYPCPN